LSKNHPVFQAVILWVMTPRSDKVGYHNFGGSFCLSEDGGAMACRNPENHF